MSFAFPSPGHQETKPGGGAVQNCALAPGASTKNNIKKLTGATCREQIKNISLIVATPSIVGLQRSFP
jgi:hypothetical protein